MTLNTTSEQLRAIVDGAETVLAAAAQGTREWRDATRDAIEARAAFWAHKRVMYDWSQMADRSVRTIGSSIV